MKPEFIKRILSSLILIPISLLFIIKGSFFFIIFISVFFLITLYEWHMMSKNKKYNKIGHIFFIFSFYSAYFIRNELNENSLFIFIFILIICVSTDIGGYIFGKLFKGPKLTRSAQKKLMLEFLEVIFYQLSLHI